MIIPQKKFMRVAIREAEKALKNGDYGIGSVIVKDNKIIARAGETLKSKPDPVNGHAEIGAIRKACKKMNVGYLKDCTIYSTHEPCPMCASALYWSKIQRIVYGVTREDMIEHMNKKINQKFTWRQIDISCEDIIKKGMPDINIEILRGFMREECLKLLN